MHVSSFSLASPRPGSLLGRLARELSSTLSPNACLPFLAWALYSAYVFLHADAVVPDELNFLNIARGTNWRDFFVAAPPFAYGSIFWVCLKLLGSAFPARVVVLAMFLLTPYLIVRTIEAPRLKLAVLLLWLSFPIAWWTGKLIAPEIPCMFLVAVALHAFVRERLLLCAIALGLAVGTKISALPALIFFIVQFAIQPGRPASAKLRAVPLLAAGFALALLFASPPIAAIVRELRNQSNPGTIMTLERVNDALLTTRWEWDSVFSGGAMQFSLMPFPFLLVALGILARQPRIFAALALTIAAFVWINVRTQTYYGWYWITFFPILLYAVARTGDKDVPKWLTLGIVGAALINAAEHLPLIIDQASQKAEQIRVMGKRDEITACLQQKIDELAPATVFNLSEFGIDLKGPGRIYNWAEPAAYGAEVQIVGARHLIRDRYHGEDSLKGKRLYANCDTMLIFTSK
jgi:hypothetical protein